MPRGGFYAIHNSSIRFGSDGMWYADGEVIANQRIANLFARHVERAPDGTYRLRIADEQAPITVDDTPFVIIGAEVDEHQHAWVDLNDGTRELLDPASLRVGSGEVLYCQVKGGREPARFLRPAYYQIAHHILAASDGGFEFRTGERVWRIGSR